MDPLLYCNFSQNCRRLKTLRGLSAETPASPTDTSTALSPLFPKSMHKHVFTSHFYTQPILYVWLTLWKVFSDVLKIKHCCWCQVWGLRAHACCISDTSRQKENTVTLNSVHDAEFKMWISVNTNKEKLWVMQLETHIQKEMSHWPSAEEPLCFYTCP